MTWFQRLIKTSATVLAVILAAAIIGGIVKTVLGLSLLTDLFTGGSSKDDTASVETVVDFDTKEITGLDIELAASTLRIEVGDTLRVSGDKASVTVKQNGNTIVVKEEDKLFLNDSGLVTLTLPKEFSFATAEIDMGAGELEAETLIADKLELSVGAGKATMESLMVSGTADIETGAGSLEVSNGAIGTLDLELGVGKATLSTSLGNGSRAECGVGELKLTLLGGADAYTVQTATGIGRFTVDGKTVSDGERIGSGAAVITLEGGIGSVDVVFA